MAEIAKHAKESDRKRNRNVCFEGNQLNLTVLGIFDVQIIDYTSCYRPTSKISTAAEWFCGIGIITLFVFFRSSCVSARSKHFTSPAILIDNSLSVSPAPINRVSIGKYLRINKLQNAANRPKTLNQAAVYVKPVLVL